MPPEQLNKKTDKKDIQNNPEKKTKASVLKTVAERVMSLDQFEDIKYAGEVAEKKIAGDPNFEAEYNQIIDAAIDRIATLLETAPQHAKKTSPEGQLLIDASVKWAKKMCKQRKSPLDNKIKTDFENNTNTVSLSQKAEWNQLANLERRLNKADAARKF